MSNNFVCVERASSLEALFFDFIFSFAILTRIFDFFLMARCDVTGKGTAFGNNRSHANNKTRRSFNANIQKKILDNGSSSLKVNLSTRVIKTLGKDDPKMKKMIAKLGLKVK